MGQAAIFQTLVGSEPCDSDHDNVIILKLEKELDRLADQLGVRRLSSFCDFGSMAEEFADELGGDAHPGSEAWFDARQGVQTCEALAKAVNKRPKALDFKSRTGREHWIEMLKEELEYCRARSAEAVIAGQRFRLLIVS